MRTPKGPQSPSSLQRGTLPCCPCRAPGCRGCCAQSRSGPVTGAAAPSEVANSEHGGSSGQGREGYEPPPHHRKSPDPRSSLPACLPPSAHLGLTGSQLHTLTGPSASAGAPGPPWWTPGLPGTKVTVGAALVVWGVTVQCVGVQGETRAGGGGPEGARGQMSWWAPRAGPRTRLLKEEKGSRRSSYWVE